MTLHFQSDFVQTTLAPQSLYYPFLRKSHGQAGLANFVENETIYCQILPISLVYPKNAFIFSD